MINEQTYWLDFPPPRPFSSFRGAIRVQGAPTDETASVGLYDSDGERIAWSVVEFAQFRQDLSKALELLRDIKATTIARGGYRAKVGQWLEVIRSGDMAHLQLTSWRGFVTSLNEAAVVETIGGLPAVETAINDAVLTYRRLRK